MQRTVCETCGAPVGAGDDCDHAGSRFAPGDPLIAVCLDAIYNDALGFVAMGETRDDTFNQLLDWYPQIEAADISREMDDAARDALKQGVTRDDIDPSWF